MTKNEKMAKRLSEWRTALEVLEQKLTEMTLQIERQRGAIAAAETLLAMADDEVQAGSSGIATFSDAGALATADNLDDVGDGSTYGKLRKTIIGGGYILIGSGTKDSTLDGWIMDSSEIVGQLNGADQVILSATDGTVRAGDTVLRAAGIDLEGDTAPLTTESRAINWWLDVDNPTGDPISSVYNYVDGSIFFNQNAVLQAKGDATNTNAAAWLRAESYNGSNVGYWIAMSGQIIQTNCALYLTGSSPSMGSNWTNTSLTTRYFSNIVEIFGAVTAGASPSTTLFTLSTALRPSAAHWAVALQVNGGFTAAQLVKINTTGTVVATGWTPTNGDVVYFQTMFCV